MIDLIKFKEREKTLRTPPPPGSATDNLSHYVEVSKDGDYNAVFAAGCDGTAINTSVTFDIIQRLEESYFGHLLQ